MKVEFLNSPCEPEAPYTEEYKKCFSGSRTNWREATMSKLSGFQQASEIGPKRSEVETTWPYSNQSNQADLEATYNQELKFPHVHYLKHLCTRTLGSQWVRSD